MLKSCQYCGRVHDTRWDCGMKPVRVHSRKRGTAAEKFRSTAAWTKKSIEVRQRDNFCCQACMRNLYGTRRQIEYDGLSVHHAVPIEKDFDRRLDNRNLITLCKRHHDMADNGDIELEKIQKIINEQENQRGKVKYPPS